MFTRLTPFCFVRSGGSRDDDTALRETVSRKDDEIKSIEQRKKDIASRSRCVNGKRVQ